MIQNNHHYHFQLLVTRITFLIELSVILLLIVIVILITIKTTTIMPNSKFNPELYQEMLLDEGCIYDEEIREECFEQMLCDYL